MRRLCSLPIILFTFLLAPVAPGGQAVDGRPERVVVYIDADIPRVKQAIAKLEAALSRTGVAARHHVVVRLVVVDLWNDEDVAAKMRHALARRPAALIATNSGNAEIAKSIAGDTPILFGSHQDPVRLGLVKSLASPGGNLTGFTYFIPIDQKRLEILRELAPRARKLGILVDRWWLKESGGREVVAGARLRQGFEPELFQAETLDELRAVLASPRARAVDSWYVPYTALPFAEPAALLKAFDELRKPVVFPATSFIERGGLLSYQQTLTLDESALLWATMIGLILDGVPPGEIPVERPKAFELAINVAAARRLGVAIPVSLLKRADRVFPAVPERAAAAK